MNTDQTGAIIGLDVGTTSTKGMLFDLSGAVLTSAEYDYAIFTPQPGWVEQQPDDVWSAVLKTLHALTEQAGAERRVLALALAAQSSSVIPAKKDGTPVYPMITWMDSRATEIVNRWRAEGHTETIRQTSGGTPQASVNLAIISWLRENRRDVFTATEHFFSADDFLVHRLTGRHCTNPSNGGRTQLLNIATEQWAPALCALAGIEPDQISPVQPSGTIVGRLLPKVCEATGLSEATVVINGGHDQACTALGLGVTEPGHLLLACGTSWVITDVVEAPPVALPEQLSLDAYPPPQRWTVSQLLGGLGACLTWLLDQCWPSHNADGSQTRADRFAALNAALRQTTPGSDGLFFLPLTGGHRAATEAEQGAFLGLRLDHTRANMARAVLEGAAYEVRWALDHIREAEIPVDALWMIGGATRSSLWPQIIADVTQLPVTLPASKDWPAVGAAILAGAGVGVFDSLDSGQVRFQGERQLIAPEAAHTLIYDQYFAQYQQIAQSTHATLKGIPHEST